MKQEPSEGSSNMQCTASWERAIFSRGRRSGKKEKDLAGDILGDLFLDFVRDGGALACGHPGVGKHLE